MAKKFCTGCGAVFEERAQFCDGCGAAVIGPAYLASVVQSRPFSIKSKTAMVGVMLILGSVGSFVWALNAAQEDWFVPITRTDDDFENLGYAGTGEVKKCGYMTFGGKIAEIPRATRTGHFLDLNIAAVGNDAGWILIKNRKGDLDEGRNLLGSPAHINFENVAYIRPQPAFAYASGEWELSPYYPRSPRVFVTEDGLQASTAGTHYADASDIERMESQKRISQNGFYGFEDGSQKIVVTPKYDYATRFTYNTAGVSQNGKWSFITNDGAKIATALYDDVQVGRISPNNDDYWTVRSGDKWGLIEITHGGELPNMTPEQRAKQFLARVSVAPKFDYALPFIKETTEGTFIAKTQNGWQIFDKNGTPKSTEIYEDISMPVTIATPGFFQALAGGFLYNKLTKYGERFSIIAVKSAGLWGYIDLSGYRLVGSEWGGRPCGMVTVNESLGILE